MEGPKNKPSESSSMFVVGSLFLVAGLLYFYGVQNANSNHGPAEVSLIKSAKQTEDLVNKHLQETNHKIETQRLKGSIENGFIAPKIGQMVPLKANSDESISLDEPGTAGFSNSDYENLPADVSRDESSPRAIIESQLADKQRLEDYNREYRRKYIQAFIENAKKNGWNIQVDKEGVVTKAVPIPGFDRENSGSKLNIFHPNVSGGEN